MESDSVLAPLIGTIIRSIGVSSDHTLLVFGVEKPPLRSISPQVFVVEGECCSFSWFHEILGVDYLLGATVTHVGDLDDSSCKDADSDYLRVYGYAITTDTGNATVIFRNESNGYYGGWCDQVDARHVPADLTMITADWTADGN